MISIPWPVNPIRFCKHKQVPLYHRLQRCQWACQPFFQNQLCRGGNSYIQAHRLEWMVCCLYTPGVLLSHKIPTPAGDFPQGVSIRINCAAGLVGFLVGTPSRWGESRRFVGRNAGNRLARIDWLVSHIAALTTEATKENP